MLKFFRRIRRKLIDEGNLKRYLIYAIGEILLVMIGILLALQVNNWNEQRKLKAEEIIMLRNFRTSIEEDFKMAKDLQITFEKVDNSINILLDHMRKDLTYQDSLKIHFGHTTELWAPAINQEVFESLTSTDLNIISNDRLKKEIIAYYSFARRNFEVLIDRYTKIIEDASKDLFSKRFDSMWSYSKDEGYPMIPNDFEALKKDKEYMYFLGTLTNQLFWYMRDPLEKS